MTQSPARSGVVVTGASTGIGEACALRLARGGFRVFAGVRREADGEALIAKAGGDVRPVLLDVTQERSIREAAERLAEHVGEAEGLVGLVNNAGIAVGGPLEVLPIDALRHQLEVNVVGLVAVTQTFLPLLRRGHAGAPGRIVNIGSVSGRLAGPFMAPYAASKHAVEALSDSLRVELRPWRIHVSLVQPGRIQTPIWRKSLAASEALAASVDPAALARYERALERVRAYIQRNVGRRVPADRVAAVVERALTSPKPKTRYVVGLDAHLQLFFVRFVPDRVRDTLISRLLGLPGPAGSGGPGPAPDEWLHVRSWWSRKWPRRPQG